MTVLFRSGRARSSRHSFGQPCWRTAAPRLHRCSLYVCGSRPRRAWGLACTAPELCPYPSARERLLDIRTDMSIQHDSYFPSEELGKKKRFSEVVSWNKKQFSPNSPNSPWPKTWLPSPKLAYHQDLCCTLPAFITLTKTLLMLKVCVQQLKQSSAQSDGKTVKKKQKWLMMTHRNPGGQAEVSQRILTGIKCTLGTIKIRSSQSA